MSFAHLLCLVRRQQHGRLASLHTESLLEYLLCMSAAQRLACVLLLACRDAMCEIEDVAAHLKGGKWAPSQESLLPILQFADWATKHTNYPSVGASRCKAAEQGPVVACSPNDAD
jgi:hypothetical protein